MYEVEVMLGETDETHIIRTIEYWDNEKRRWPQRQHYAVLVAENINRRFFNVIHLLSNAIPIIAIQASLVESNGVKSLFFTTVLDTYEELDDGTATEEQNYDKEFWNKKAKWVTEAAEALLPIAAKQFKSPSLRYLKQYVHYRDREFAWTAHRLERGWDGAANTPTQPGSSLKGGVLTGKLVFR